ncbi:MAG: hypothetical protein KDK55_05915 [Chlamydiia bacterium]|nr:hypothetical protein [Chlamydiia bacterium]
MKLIRCLPLILSVLFVVGSLTAAGCLYGQIGNWSLVMGSGGLIVALTLTAIGLCYTYKISSQQFEQGERDPPVSKYSDPPNGRDSKNLRHSNFDRAKVSNFNDRKQPNSNLSLGSPIIDKSQKLLRQPTSDFSSCLEIPSIRATHIELPETLPKQIPSKQDIFKKKFLTATELNTYIAYLSTKYSGIFVPNDIQLGYRANIGFDNARLYTYIFEYLPSKISNLNKLNLPIYLHVSNNHWTLIYIDREKRTVEYYDSFKNYGNHQEIVRTLGVIAEQLSEEEPHRPHYTVVLKMNKVLQSDGYQCGPWVLYFLENRLINSEVDFNQLDRIEAKELIKKHRIKIALKLIEMRQASADIQKEELENYLQHYKEESLSHQIYAQDLKKIPPTDRWKQILEGKPLTPAH